MFFGSFHLNTFYDKNESNYCLIYIIIHTIGIRDVLSRYITIKICVFFFYLIDVHIYCIFYTRNYNKFVYLVNILFKFIIIK